MKLYENECLVTVDLLRVIVENCGKLTHFRGYVYQFLDKRLRENPVEIIFCILATFQPILLKDTLHNTTTQLYFAGANRTLRL